MPLSLNEIKARALAFSREWEGAAAERDLPRYIIVSDFARIRLHDLDSKTRNELRISSTTTTPGRTTPASRHPLMNQEGDGGWCKDKHQ